MGAVCSGNEEAPLTADEEKEESYAIFTDPSS